MSTYKCYYNENFFMVCDIGGNKSTRYTCKIYPIIHIDGKHYVRHNIKLDSYALVHTRTKGTFANFVEECTDILMTKCHINDYDNMRVYIIDDHSVSYLIRDRKCNKHFSIIEYDNMSSHAKYMSDLRFEDGEFIEDSTDSPMIDSYKAIRVEMKPYEYKLALY